MRSLLITFAFGAMIASLGMAQTVRYTVTDLGTFGGNFSVAFGINNAGRVGGTAATASGDTHAFVWGVTKTDLGTLGGHNSQPGGPSGSLEMSILSETATPDPLNEDFCGFGNHLTCRAGMWNGAMKPLPNLPGGNNALAFGINSRGQIIGAAENGTHDSACPSPQVLDYVPVTWMPNTGVIQSLPPLSGDTVGFTLGINDRGQIVGVTGTCDNTVLNAVGLVIGPHAVLWEGGAATNLGSLGGSMNKAAAINSRGEIAGLSSLPNDASVHAFLWIKDKGMQDIGTLGSDSLSDPAGINNSTQIVGGSCDDSGNCRGFLWEDNKMTDLNDLIDPESPYYLLYALNINDVGEIVGFAFVKETGEVHAYVAHPARGKSGKSAQQTTESRQGAVPENVRRLMRQRLPNLTVGSVPR